MDPIEELDTLTYIHDHNPRLRLPHLVTLADGREGSGKTFGEAARQVLADKNMLGGRLQRRCRQGFPGHITRLFKGA